MELVRAYLCDCFTIATTPPPFQARGQDEMEAPSADRKLAFQVRNVPERHQPHLAADGSGSTAA